MLTLDHEALGLVSHRIEDMDPFKMAARREACRLSFSYFLRHVKTEEGDYPLWQFQQDLADRLSAGEWMVILKRRQVMATWTTAALAVWKIAYGDNPSHVALFSKDEDTVLEVVRRMKVIIDNLPDYLKVKYRGTSPMTILDNGNFVKPFPATQSAGIGRSYALAIFDEFAEHVYAKDNLAKVTPAVTNSKGQIVLVSAANPDMGPAGMFFTVWDKAYGAGQKPYSPIFVDRWVRPDQQGEEWLAEERSKYPDMSDAYFNALYPENPSQAFLSQSGLVYGIDETDGTPFFDPKRNIVKKPTIKWADCTFRLVGIDPGGSDPSGLVALGVYRDGSQPNMIVTDRMHVYASRRHPGPISVEDADEWLKYLEVTGHIHKVLVDPTQKSLIASLARRGWPVENTRDMSKNPINRREIIASVQHLFKTGRLTILEGDPMLREIESYWWDDNAREFVRSGQRSNFLTKTPNWHHADLLDSLRYTIAAMYKYYPGRVRKASTRVGRATDLVANRRY